MYHGTARAAAAQPASRLRLVEGAATKRPKPMSEPLTDQVLVERAKRGDEIAFSELVNRHYRRAVRVAYGMAGISADNVSVAEVHDCFGVMGAMSAEIIGKAEVGRGAQYFVDGRAAPGGDCAINTSGGLIAKGHPIGATGVAMVGWSYNQIVGDVPEPLRAKSIDHAVTFNIGGPICASAVHVLRGKN